IRVDVDVRALVRGVVEEGDAAPQGSWHVTAFALRALLGELRATTLLVVDAVRANKRGSDLAEACRELDATLARAGAGADGERAASSRGGRRADGGRDASRDKAPARAAVAGRAARRASARDEKRASRERRRADDARRSRGATRAPEQERRAA